jgi:opacity protein-like surface antigen
MALCVKKCLLLMLSMIPALGFASGPEKVKHWYIRLDAGVSAILDNQMTLRLESPPIYTDEAFTLSINPNNILVGLIGIGYHINEYLRADFTLQEYMKRRFDGVCTRNTQSFCTDGRQKGYLQTDMEFVNAYFELGPFMPPGFSQLKPYVGGGIGMATQYSTQTYFYQNDEYVAEVTSGTRVNFAGRGILGLAVEVYRNVAIDFWYTFTHGGHMVTGHHMFLGEVDNSKNYLWERGSMVLNQNEVFAGIRYSF